MEKEPNTIMGLRASALLETLLFLIAALVIDFVLGAGVRFRDVCPHPFWIIVLLVSVQYGTKEGLITALAATIVLLFGNMPEQAINQNMYDYLFAVAKTPLSWLVAAVILGELRMKHIRERAELRQALDDSEERETRITQSYQFVKDLKEKMELKIAGQLRSSVATYQAAKAMEALHPSEVIGGLESLVIAVMNPEKFSIYTLGADGLSVTLTHGWRDSDNYARQLTARTELYRATIGSRNVLSAANAEHEQMLSGQGVLAGPLVNRDTGEVVGLLKIEKLGFTDLNLSSIETFAAICDWAGMAIVNARKYQTAKDGSIINPDHNLHTPGYFHKYAEYVTALGKRVGFDVSMLLVKMNNADDMAPELRTRVAQQMSEAVDSVLRGVDLAFDYQGNSAEFSIILPATNRAGAEIVLEKIRTEMNQRMGATMRNINFTFSIQVLQQK